MCGVPGPKELKELHQHVCVVLHCPQSRSCSRGSSNLLVHGSMSLLVEWSARPGESPPHSSGAADEEQEEDWADVCPLCAHKRTTTVRGSCALTYCEECINPHTCGKGRAAQQDSLIASTEFSYFNNQASQRSPQLWHVPLQKNCALRAKPPSLPRHADPGQQKHTNGRIQKRCRQD